MNDASLSVVVPVYNSQENLGPLLRRIAPVIATRGCRSEVILVNDGSRDSSGQVIRHLQGEYPFVRVIDLMRNFGQHNALLCGIRAARCETIVTMDDDLQNPPEEIPKLLAKLDEGFDVVYGTPAKERHGLWRDLASVLTKWTLQGAMGVETARQVSAFRAFRTDLRRGFKHYDSPFVSIDVLLTWATTRFTAVSVRHDSRAQGQSNYTFYKLTTHALNMMTGFTVWPLQVASLVGFGTAVLGGLVLVYVLVRYLIQGGSVPGFPFLASVISIFSGAQMFAVGVLGEYLARMHQRSMGKPAYLQRRESPVTTEDT